MPAPLPSPRPSRGEGIVREPRRTSRSFRHTKRPGGRSLAGTYRRRRAGRRGASAGSMKHRIRSRPSARRSRHGRRHVSRRWLARTALVALLAISAVGLLGSVTAIAMVDYFAGDLPTIDQLQTSKLTQTSRILDRNGKLIEALYHQNRTVVR